MTATIGLVGKLKALGQSMLRQGMTDWAQMTGLALEVGDGRVQNLADRSHVANLHEGPVAVVETRVEGRCEGPFFVLMPNALALAAVGKILMIPGAITAAKGNAALQGTELEAFKELANIFCGSATQALTTVARQIRVSQNVKSLRPWQAFPDLAARLDAFPEGELACIALAVELDGVTHQVLQIIPLPLAREMVT